MIQIFRRLKVFTNRHAGKVLLAGLAAVFWRNWRLWQSDLAFLTEKARSTELASLNTWPRLPRVSILVAAWNEEANIDRHIKSFITLRYPHKELVICAGGTDRTYPKALRWAGDDITVLKQRSGEGKQRALRRCLDMAHGSVIYLTDADCILDNDSFERTILPIVFGNEDACTGGSRPYPELNLIPFVKTQAASHLYSILHSPHYAPGLLGRNCAIHRRVIETSHGLDAPAPTGTDYVLAKMITRAGVRIRQIPESQIATEYPTTIRAYLRQKRRWLRNVFLYGQRFGARDEVRASLLTSGAGAAMIGLPFSALVLGKLSFMAWFILLVHAFLSRLRYLRFAAVVTGNRNTWRDILFQIPLLFVDFIAWSRPLFDYLEKGSENKW